VQSGEDFREASFVFQHGDKPEDFLLAHVLAIAAVAKGDVTATWISAATLDRYLQSVKQGQVFGTQYLLKDPAAMPRVVTQEPYDKETVSDELRKVFCVALSATQQQNVDAINKGHDPQPDSCD
jgi:TRAP-type C4-dicarboxylate transport system substrate-binding protein